MYKKYDPKKTVKNNETTDLLKKLFIKEWCAHVTVIPLESRMIVFKRGTEYTANGTIPLGGHTIPNSILGAKAAS